jgi:hypothetical protein
VFQLTTRICLRPNRETSEITQSSYEHAVSELSRRHEEWSVDPKHVAVRQDTCKLVCTDVWSQSATQSCARLSFLFPQQAGNLWSTWAISACHVSSEVSSICCRRCPAVARTATASTVVLKCCTRLDIHRSLERCIALMVVNTSETSVSFYQPARCYIPEDNLCPSQTFSCVFVWRGTEHCSAFACYPPWQCSLPPPFPCWARRETFFTVHSNCGIIKQKISC